MNRRQNSVSRVDIITFLSASIERIILFETFIIIYLVFFFLSTYIENTVSQGNEEIPKDV